MANTLTGLYPILYNAMNIVSRERVGMVSAVSLDATAAAAAMGQTVRSPVVGAMSAGNITAAATAPGGTDQTINYVDIQITKARKVTFNLTGEEERGLGPNNASIATQRFAQAFRTLGNEMEADLTGLYVHASRADIVGTAGTAPFGTADDLTQLTEALRILDDNGAPATDRHVVLGSAAIAKLLGKQPGMFKVNEAGDEMARRFGTLQPLFNANFHHSGQVKLHTKGAGTGYDVDNNPAGYAVGDTTIHLDGGTASTTGIKAGDVVTFATDTANRYIVGTGTGDNAEADIVLNDPGLRLSVADAVELTVGNSYTANMVFSRDAFQLATRTPAVPTGGDAADDRTIVVDPISGLAFEVAVYRQYRQVSYEVGICWGVKAVSGRHAAILLG